MRGMTNGLKPYGGVSGVPPGGQGSILDSLSSWYYMLHIDLAHIVCIFSLALRRASDSNVEVS